MATWIALASEEGEHDRQGAGKGQEVTPPPHDKQNVGHPSRPDW
jgi:hypothetical protein